MSEITIPAEDTKLIEEGNAVANGDENPTRALVGDLADALSRAHLQIAAIGAARDEYHAMLVDADKERDEARAARDARIHELETNLDAYADLRQERDQLAAACAAKDEVLRSFVDICLGEIEGTFDERRNTHCGSCATLADIQTAAHEALKPDAGAAYEKAWLDKLTDEVGEREAACAAYRQAMTKIRPGMEWPDESMPFSAAHLRAVIDSIPDAGRALLEERDALKARVAGLEGRVTEVPHTFAEIAASLGWLSPEVAAKVRDLLLELVQIDHYDACDLYGTEQEWTNQDWTACTCSQRCVADALALLEPAKGGAE